MVFHVGIYPLWGEVSFFNTFNEETVRIKISSVKNNEFDKVDSMFKEIITSTKAQSLGCACICLDSDYGNEIRKKFIDSGRFFGFQKVQIISKFKADFLNTISQSTYIPAENDIIWILDYSNRCRIWQKVDGIIKFIHWSNPFRKDYFEINDIDRGLGLSEWELITKDSDFCANPTIIFYHYTQDVKDLKDLYLKLSFVPYYLLLYDSAALIHARIMAEDKTLLHLNSTNTFDIFLTAHFEDKQFFFIDRLHSLPLIRAIKIPSNKSERKIQLRTSTTNSNESHTFILPNLEDQILTFMVDTNGIWSMKCYEMLNNKVNHHYFEQTTLLRSSLKNVIFDIPKNYHFPEKILTNNEKINAVGIDLGTTRCCAAVNRRNGIETCVLENTGNRLLPSFVSYDERHEKCGQVVIDRLRNYANSTIFDSKRFIGKKFDEIKINKSWPFEVVEIFVNEPVNDDDEIEVNELCQKKVFIKLQDFIGEVYKYPEEISATLLKEIKQKAETFQGKELHEAVITVPAAFSKKQAKATYIAAILAGWKFVHLLPEPVAAAFAYFIDRPIPNNSTLLLFDLGGGTLDVCIFKIENSQLKILSRSGDPNIGGRDFDTLLVEHFENKITKKYGIQMNAAKRYKLMVKCQIIKERLSVAEIESLDVSDVDPAIEENLAITRKEFEQISIVLLHPIQESILKAIEKIDYSMDQIDKVLQVGGGCRMPMIKELLKNTFPHAEHCCEEHPDEVVAIGAAYYSYYLGLSPQSQNKGNGNCSVM